jgi:NAD(P)-dependent dehydrogenase (short-subunit alcohol dehydrogenase family)
MWGAGRRQGESGGHGGNASKGAARTPHVEPAPAAIGRSREGASGRAPAAECSYERRRGIGLGSAAEENIVMRLANKIALVTGASRGIGRASALALAAEGATVVGAARSQGDLDSLVGAIQARGGEARGVVCDVTRSSDVGACVKQTVDTFGRLDILVNNAGIGGYRPFLDWGEADYDRIMTTNAKSSWLFSREVLPYMLERGGGNIVIVSSVAGLQGFPTEGIYCMSKFAQVALAQSLDREFFQKNIKVSLVCPGGVETHFALGDGRTAGSASMKGFSTAEDVAEAVLLAVLPRERTRVVSVVLRPMGEMT